MKKLILSAVFFISCLVSAQAYTKDGPWTDVPVYDYILLNSKTNYYISAWGRNWAANFKQKSLTIGRPPLGKTKEDYPSNEAWLRAQEPLVKMVFTKEPYHVFRQQRKLGTVKRRDGTFQFGIDILNPNVKKVLIKIDEATCFEIIVETSDNKGKGQGKGCFLKPAESY